MCLAAVLALTVVVPTALSEKNMMPSMATAKTKDRSGGKGASTERTRLAPRLLRLQMDNKVSCATQEDQEKPMGQTREAGYTELLDPSLFELL